MAARVKPNGFPLPRADFNDMAWFHGTGRGRFDEVGGFRVWVCVCALFFPVESRLRQEGRRGGLVRAVDGARGLPPMAARARFYDSSTVVGAKHGWRCTTFVHVSQKPESCSVFVLGLEVMRKITP